MTALHPVFGHEAVRAAIRSSVAAGSLPATLLLHGPRGAGKQRLALWIAQLEVCGSRSSGEPCGTCRACRLTLRVEHPDVHWYFPLPRPSGSHTPEKLAQALEEARGEALTRFRDQPLQPSHHEEPRAIYMAAAQALRRRALKPSSEGGVQIFIVAESETLVPQESSPEAANALLKLLEEPPPSTRFILTSSEPGRLLPTIRSRALPLHVHGLPRPLVERFLVDVGGVSADRAAHAARLAQGSIGRALGFLPDADGGEAPLERLRAESLALLDAALAPTGAAGLSRALAQRPWGARGLADALDFLEIWVRDLAVVCSGAAERVFNVDHVSRLEALAARVRHDPVATARAGAEIDRARLDALGNVNPQLLIGGLVRGLRAALLSPS